MSSHVRDAESIICQILINRRNILLFRIGEQAGGKIFVVYIYMYIGY